MNFEQRSTIAHSGKRQSGSDRLPNCVCICKPPEAQRRIKKLIV